MPFLLALELTALSLTLALCTGLLLAVASTSIGKPLARSFVYFAAAETGFVVCSLLLRLSLYFSVGQPEILVELATLFFSLGAAGLLLFCIRFTRLPGRLAPALAAGSAAVMVALLPFLLRGMMVTDPRLTLQGLVFCRYTRLGMAAAALPAACLLAASILLAVAARRTRTASIMLGVALLFGGFAVGGIAQPNLPVLAFTCLGGVAFLGWGIIRHQLFNPLRELAGDLRERAHRQELISQIGRRTTTLLPLDGLLHQAVAMIRESFDYFTVAVFLVEGDHLVLRASTHPAVREHLHTFRLAVGSEGLCGWVAKEGRPLIVGDVSQDRRYVELLELAPTKSELTVPILRDGRVIGVLDAQSEVRDAYGERDVHTLQTIADQLSSSIENARLYEETRRRAERLAVVNRISAAAGSVLDLDDLLQTVYREVTPIFEAEAFFIALLDESSDVLDFRIQVDEGRAEAPVRQPLGSGLTSRVVLERRPVLVNDMDWEDQGADLWGTGKVPASWIGVPMLVGDRLVGVMSVQTYRGRRYDSEDLLLASTIADQVSVAVENARLYEKVLSELQVRLRTELVLRESEEKFRNLAEESPNMILIYGEERVLYANRQCELSTGYPREVLYAPGFDLRSLIAPGYDVIATRSLDSGSPDSGSPDSGSPDQETPPSEIVLITHAGTRMDCILTTRLIRYAEAPAVLSIITDITARKRTERLLQSLNAATLAMEQALTPSEIFPSALRVLAGLGFDSAVFMSCADPPRMLRTHCRGSGRSGEARTLDEGGGGLLLPYDASADVARALDGRQALYSTQDLEALVLFFGDLPHARSRPGGVIFAPLVLDDLPFGLLVVAGQDLGPEDLQVFTAFAHQAAAAWRKTRLVRDLEDSLEKLSRTQEQLLHSQKMEAVGRLAGGIAHDFNNLLTVISGYTSLLADMLEGNAPALGDLGQIRTTIKRAAALTGRLLAFGRKQILQPTVLDLNKVVATSVTLLQPLIGEDIELVVRLAADPLWLRADHGQLDQVLMNLAVNARDAMPQGGKLFLETSRLEPAGAEEAGLPEGSGGPDVREKMDEPGPGRAGPWVVLKVQDGGVGMSEDTQEHVFEPFFTTKEEGKGSGLGLSTVYGIVTQAGGTIQVQSAEGLGSTFTVVLPMVTPGGERPASEEAPRGVLSGSGTVLLVEDEAEVRALTTRVLERGGYVVLPVASAREALLVAEGTTVLDLVITDVVMPGGMSGVEMGDRLSRTRPGLPVLYISGYSDDGRLQAAGSRGMEFLGKPFQPHELLARVKSILTEDRAP
jgi:signal transduction histidine kinase/putative methionine-R-sulfoxide reductase with GAF domain